jgi:hypothetical protein
MIRLWNFSGEIIMRHRTLLVAGCSALLAGCAAPPIAPPRPRNPAPVAASFGKTWDATVAELNARHLRIASSDRNTGVIVADSVEVEGNDPNVADCGSMMGVAVTPTAAWWSAVVHGDSTQSTVKASVKFSRTGMSRDALNKNTVTETCSSYGTWEAEFEQAVAARAEGKPPATGTP